MSYKLKISPRWSGGRKTARAAIRKSLRRQTKDPAAENTKNFHRFEKGYFSISHTRGMGGYILASQPSGFDIEPQNRTVSERVFKRLTTPQERDLGFSPLEAWIAKEAAFKALTAHNDLKTITEVRLNKRFKKGQGQIIEFSFKHSYFNNLGMAGHGFIKPYKRFLLGIAHISP